MNPTVQQVSLPNLIQEDHRAILHLFDELKIAGVTRRVDRQDVLSRRLCAHFAAEEETMYVEVANVAGMAEAITRARDEHARMKAMLERIEVDHSSFNDQLAVLRISFEVHIGQEENSFLPALLRETKAGVDTLGLEWTDALQRAAGSSGV